MGEGVDRRRLRRRVTREEAARILGTTYENVRYLQRRGQLRGQADRRGHYWFDRREVEELARRRRLRVDSTGKLAARVFALFKEKRPFEDIVIETQQAPDVVLALWERYCAGFGAAHAQGAAEGSHERARRDES